MKKLTFGLMLISAASAFAAKTYNVTSPDGHLKADINIDTAITYAVTFDQRAVLDPSPVTMTLQNGTVWGRNPKVTGTSKTSVDKMVASPLYRADKMRDNYNSLTLKCKGGFGVEFRAYNDGVAYRFISSLKQPQVIQNEGVEYNFPIDAQAWLPFTKGDYPNDPYINSFENLYAKGKLSEMDKSRMAFLPVLVQLDDSLKVCITESDLEQFPGLYLHPTGDKSLRGSFARYPKVVKQGGYNELQMVVHEREDFIAKVDGTRTYPWRVAIVSTTDKGIAASNLSYLLASPSRVADVSWIKPGKVAWDWWNNWNITGVDFEAGINNDTYKKYIDFAGDHGVEYVILDEGWSVNKKADLMQVVPQIDLKELVAHGAKKNVGIVLWAGYWAFDRDMENVCKYYADMGIKGFKVDFMDRDDQQMVDFVHRASKMAAKYGLFLDLHGMYKPAGINRTYPNLLNFEGVFGLEQMKWTNRNNDQMEYDVSIPFIRQVAGPMDYTPGAMNNATKSSYNSVYREPMSQGTRCHQLALFTIFEHPFAMLCDSPSNYDREPESRDFIASVPTTWDETIVLDGKVGDYVVMARRKGDKWYVAGLTDWNPRDITVDLSFLGNAPRKAVIFKDGANAHRNARDYKREVVTLDPSTPLKLHLAPGGGFSIAVD